MKLKPWAQWMINHKLKWLLLIYTYLTLPSTHSVMEWAEVIDCINYARKEGK